MLRSSRRACAVAAALAAAWIPGARARGEVEVRFELSLESPELPDLDTSAAIDGAPGSEHLFTANMLIGTSGITEGGIQGWASSLWHAGVDVVSVTDEGTVTAEASARQVLHDAFVKYEVIDPAKNGGKTGVVQAVVLSFTHPIILPPNTSQLVGRNLYRARVGEAGSIAFIRYEDRLAGSGQPVQNAATYEGATVYPVLGARRIAIGRGAVPESTGCDDGVDNDHNGWTDCNDPDCRGEGPCQPEVCGDGIDNDRDGLADCRDPDCRGSPACPEVCGDGEDNDQDGLTDCADPDCRFTVPCRETCDDGTDNNGDGLVDCADPDCTGRPPCPGPEQCEDGVDNDQDGETDCGDPDCALSRACRRPEVCDDGIDNNGDGRVDCADLDCRGHAACPGAEVCQDGVDNDGDGAYDCDDGDCAEDPTCAAAGGGGGFDLVLGGPATVRDGARNVAVVRPHVTLSVPVVIYIVPDPAPQPQGVQGWSLSIRHDREVLEFDPDGGAPTVDGTDAAALFSGGFEKTEAIDPAKNAGSPLSPPGGGAGNEADGFVSAVVLSFTEPRELDPTREQSVVRAKYRVKGLEGTGGAAGGGAGDGAGDAAGGAQGRTLGGVRFQDGLRGSGQPVQNILTVRGGSVVPRRFVPLEIRLAGPDGPFVRGDANGDRKVNIADGVWCVNELVRRGPSAPCQEAADMNADGLYDLSDAVYLIQWLFLSGPVIPPPFPACGFSAGPSGLHCPEGSVAYCP